MKYLAILLISCVTAQETLADQVDDLQFELLHVWSAPVEQQALAVIKNSAESKGISWSDYAIDGHLDAIRREFVWRVSAGLAPTAFLWSDNLSLSDLVEIQVIRTFKVHEVDPQMDDFFWPQIRELLYLQNGINMVPLGIHSLNVVIYNNEILKALDAAPPGSWKEFMDIAERASLAGYVPLALSSQPWQLRYILQSMLIEEFSNQEIGDLLKGNFPDDAVARLIPMFERLRKLQNYADENAIDRDWNDTTRAVIDGDALAQVLGDYIKSEVPEQGFTCGLSPGNTRILWGIDAIVFFNTDHPGERRAQEMIASSLLEKETQIAYNKAKGGLPARSDLGGRIVPGCFKGVVDGWMQEGKLDIGQSLSLPWSSDFEVSDGVLHSYWVETEMSARKGAQIFLEAIESK